MNYRMIFSTLGKALKIEGIFMLLPMSVGLIYRESSWSSFLAAALITTLAGVLLDLKKPESPDIHENEGFIIVGLAWIAVSLFGAFPYVMSRSIPSFVDALFETVSGFSTTGSSILREVESLDRCILFWRSFTHWIGGMGVLVFVLAVLPLSEGRSIHIMRAEMPGPAVGKIVARVKSNAMILYGIYIALTLIMVLLLAVGKMPLFDCLVNSFATAGTGGFAVKNAGIAAYDSVYIEGVITVFMLLFSINFNLYFLILSGHIIQALKSEEFRWFLGIVVSAIFAVTICNLYEYGNVIQSFRYASFQVASIISTTGFATANFDLWSVMSRSILVLLMFFGACAGSTGGGIKTARIMIMVKTVAREIRRLLHPRSISVLKMEGKPVDQAFVHGIAVYFITYMGIIAASILLISLDGKDMVTTSTSIIACMNNIGPGLGMVGPSGNYADFSAFSKIVLSLDMLLGRLEIFPIFMLFSPAVWRRS